MWKCPCSTRMTVRQFKVQEREVVVEIEVEVMSLGGPVGGIAIIKKLRDGGLPGNDAEPSVPNRLVKFACGPG